MHQSFVSIISICIFFSFFWNIWRWPISFTLRQCETPTMHARIKNDIWFFYIIFGKDSQALKPVLSADVYKEPSDHSLLTLLLCDITKPLIPRWMVPLIFGKSDFTKVELHIVQLNIDMTMCKPLFFYFVSNFICTINYHKAMPNKYILCYLPVKVMTRKICKVFLESNII